jgi:hypothetical protein
MKEQTIKELIDETRIFLLEVDNRLMLLRAMSWDQNELAATLEKWKKEDEEDHFRDATK